MLSHAQNNPTRCWLPSQGLAGGSWEQAIQAHALCAHLNFSGQAVLHWADGQGVELPSRTLIWSRAAVQGQRLPGKERHECLTLVFPDSWLSRMLPHGAEDVPEALRSLLTQPQQGHAVASRALTAEDRSWAMSEMAPHLCDAARLLLESARLTDFLAKELFLPADEPTAAPVSRTQRAAQERVEKAKALLLDHLDANLSLDDLAQAAGCSPHYLSRTFTQVEGVPLVLWLRRIRMDRAAELLASGQCNVSEAALEVGYRSLSHFSRAFAEEKGIQPSRWVQHLSGTH